MNLKLPLTLKLWASCITATNQACSHQTCPRSCTNTPASGTTPDCVLQFTVPAFVSVQGTESSYVCFDSVCQGTCAEEIQKQLFLNPAPVSPSLINKASLLLAAERLTLCFSPVCAPAACAATLLCSSTPEEDILQVMCIVGDGAFEK